LAAFDFLKFFPIICLLVRAACPPLGSFVEDRGENVVFANWKRRDSLEELVVAAEVLAGC
jgi:hypothetical protein